MDFALLSMLVDNLDRAAVDLVAETPSRRARIWKRVLAAETETMRKNRDRYGLRLFRRSIREMSAQLEAGHFDEPSIQADDSVACWGDNKFGQLGIGSEDAGATCFGDPCAPTPRQVANLKASAIAAGGTFTLALDTDGTLQAWGDNTYGQLTRDPASCSAPNCGRTPVKVIGLPSPQ